MLYNFELSDAGTFMFNVEGSGRCCIRHPHDSYTPNPSNGFDTYVCDIDAPNSLPAKFIGTFKTQSEAEFFLSALIFKGKTCQNIISTQNEFYHSDYTFK